MEVTHGAPRSDGQDVFVHYSHIDEEGFRLLKDGEEVDYELVEGDKGYQARSVQRLEAEAPASGGSSVEESQRQDSSIST